MDRTLVKKEILPIAMLSLLIFALFIAFARVTNPTYMLLTLAGVYVVISNAKVISLVWKTNPSLSGGALAHIGMGLMLIGIMFSAGYSKVVSLNNNGLLISKERGTEFNRDNLLLFLNEPRQMAEYNISYLGERLELRNKNGYAKRYDVAPTNDPFKVVAKRDIVFQGKKLYNARDTFEIYPENTYYEIELSKGDRVAATLFPRVQINPGMGGFIASPDIKKDLTRDLYTHVSLPMNPDAEAEWSETEEVKVKVGQQFFVNDYVAVLEEVRRIDEVPGLHLEADDAAVMARVKVTGERDTYYAEPVFVIKGRAQVGRLPEEIQDLGIKITLLNIHPDTQEFTFGLTGRQKDWVVIKAMEKPMINVLWLGTALLMVGFSVAMVRRFREFRKQA
jgi:cytochrome c-type biogenesis protein CcmF